MVTEVVFAREHTLDLQDYCTLMEASTLAERRPMDDRARLEQALQHTNLILTARKNGLLIGAARSMTISAFAVILPILR